MKPLPSSAWQLLEQAQGIQIGGVAGSRTSIQIIFDANCPHCAKLYETLRQKYPEVATRWVPIAYFRPDSGSIAAAMLRSSDPTGSLDSNYRQYDFKKRHGGYRGATEGLYLSAANMALRRHWQTWGGFTPMVVIRTARGEIFKSGIYGPNQEVLQAVFQKAMPALRPYQPASTEGP